MSRNNQGMMPNRQQMQQRPMMSPWEGGCAPGGGGGLLPTPLGSNFVPQLSSPEAQFTQLAAASNLLSTLFRPLQQNAGQVPPLLGTGNRNLSNYSPGNTGGYSQYSAYPRNQGMSGPPAQQTRNYGGRNRSPNRSTRGQQSNVRDSNSRSRSTDQGKRDSKRDRPRQDSSSKSESNEKRGARYEGLPRAAFNCHICEKDMWDPKSFDNHVQGIAHKREIEEREKTYQSQTILMRQKAKIAEEQNEIEVARLARLGKAPPPNRRDHCMMCDFSFLGDIAAHRKSRPHQNLKNFLHPSCNLCHKEFHIRIELDHHVLSPSHLKRKFKDQLVPVVKKEKEEKPKAEDTSADAKQSENDVEMKDVEENEEEKKDETSQEEEELMVYNPDVAVGEEYLIPVVGMFCKICSCFLNDEDPSQKSHSKSINHFNKVMLQKTKQKEKRALLNDSKEVVPDESKRIKLEDEVYDPMEETPDPALDEEGNSDPALVEEGNPDPALYEEGNPDPALNEEETPDVNLDQENNPDKGTEKEENGIEDEKQTVQGNNAETELDKSINELEAVVNDGDDNSPRKTGNTARRGRSRPK